ncbi:hypothetical protein CpB0366 [Chlamydia pneumoniae TW-183]|uniref:Uncharacterized protein n=3 Tax=Chlamydia pneumoniae TaxID=83558 RepID=Q9Z8I5_CHLPN|nr:hypothetical protein CPn_0358 [Chlamydia pneumoniae CWL029]AAF38245.1 hypothetical protein CP_0400 [Chlamydia pneumoniae AR39]AAP98297.1 hypothetical protein CpB0366 [Chlamydia pneumoniae TW-183]BAA98566.1 hypothetical protein [Chlamydia pneumoniae J138]CRI52750.1 Uncharacterized protein BN1224_Wien2_F_00090 [Chlamydia pneumoniae]
MLSVSMKLIPTQDSIERETDSKRDKKIFTIYICSSKVLAGHFFSHLDKHNKIHESIGV